MLYWVKTTERVGTRDVVEWKVFEKEPTQEVLDMMSMYGVVAEIATPPEKFLMLEKERLENKIKNFKKILVDVDRLLSKEKKDE